MIGLQQYINEAYNEKEYGVLLDRVDLKDVKDAKKIAKAIEDGLDQAMTRYKVIRVEAVEAYNKKRQSDHDAQMAKAIEREQERVIAYMKTKPGIMKRKPEKQQEYIDKKMEKFKAEYPKAKWLAEVDFPEKYMRVYFHGDIHSGNSKTEYSNEWIDNTKKAERIADDIVSGQKHDKAWQSLEGLFITVHTSALTDQWVSFEIYPDFPDDVQKELDKEVRNFGKFMSSQYGNGRYMGD